MKIFNRRRCTSPLEEALVEDTSKWLYRTFSSDSTLSASSDEGAYNNDSSSHSKKNHKKKDRALHRRVRFEEDGTQNIILVVHAYPDRQQDDQEPWSRRTMAWYAKQELKTIRQAHYQHVDATKLIESHSRYSWMNTLQAAYQQICQTGSLPVDAGGDGGKKKRWNLPRRNSSSNNTTTPSAATMLVGLDQWIVSPLSKDKAARRRRISEALQHYNDATTIVLSTSDDDAAEMLRQASRTASQPARLYAHYVALRLAAAEAAVAVAEQQEEQQQQQHLDQALSQLCQ